MHKILKYILIAISIVITFLLILVLWLTLTDFQPPLSEKAEVTNKTNELSPSTLSILNWNIGYGGLGENMDFFMDGGTLVRAPESEYDTNRNGIIDFISNSSAQVYFVQEIDRKSTRSYKEDQYLSFSEILRDYNSSFTKNFDVKYIPAPTIIGTQYGSVLSGLAIFSKYPIVDSTRISLPGNYKWPKKVFFLDRCMLVSEINGEKGERIVLINTHKSAYDKGGFLKKEQLDFIKEFAMKKYSEGKYVIIGGDWNSYLPGTDENSFQSEEEVPVFYKPLPEDWSMDNWNWAVDVNTPTNRSLAEAYIKDKTFTSVIDGFLLSPNIKLKEVKTFDLQFQYSDHNPTKIVIELM